MQVRKRRISVASLLMFAGLAALVAWFAQFNITTTPVASAAGGPVIFFSPHQDDETLTMGAAIIAHRNAGRPVYVVFVGDGTTTGARATICSQRGVCLTPAQIGAARNKEALAATTALGVPAANVSFENVPEMHITPMQAQTVINKYVTRFGVTATYVTMSWLDMSADHYNLGYALNSRCIPHYDLNKKVVVPAQLSDCRFYQSPLYQPGSTLGSFDKVAPQGYGYYTLTAESDKTRLKNAINAYKLWDPTNGRYSVGYTSVSSQFNHVLVNMKSLWHKPSSAFTDPAATQAQSNFIFKYQFGASQVQ